MKINIVNYEMPGNGILSKYANKMAEHLAKYNEVSIKSGPDKSADVNHHINYFPYRGGIGANTLMITHFYGDLRGHSVQTKLNIISEGLKTAKGICFSRQIYEYLLNLKYPKDKLTYVLPAHDGHKRKKKVIAVLTNAYPDNRKREQMLIKLSEDVNLQDFEFKIMGTGWEGVLPQFKAKYTYYGHFNMEKYTQILETSDFSLYTGAEDEGSIGILDSVNVGLQIISPIVGFHNEFVIDYPFNTQDELNEIFRKLAFNPVIDWTWENYTKAHYKIWEELLQANK